jgi:hypothetical protein
MQGTQKILCKNRRTPDWQILKRFWKLHQILPKGCRGIKLVSKHISV